MKSDMCSQHIDKEHAEDISEHTDIGKQTHNTWVIDNTFYQHPTDHNLSVTSENNHTGIWKLRRTWTILDICDT